LLLASSQHFLEGKSMQDHRVPRSGTTLAAAFAVCCALAPAALAGNGHFLHASGAIHSALGGVGTALPAAGTLGALYVNPALLAAAPDGHSFELGVELVDNDPSIASSVQTPIGTLSGRTEDQSDLAMIPAFGWSRGSQGGTRTAFGMGVLALAGFSTEYPQDPSNPLLAPQPFGFGAVYSSYRYIKLPFAAAWQVTPELALGVALNGGWAALAATPFGGTAPDCSGPTTCFFPSLPEDTAFGYGLQAGLYWTPTPTWGFGFAYSTEQEFEDFEWDATHANPNRPDFGTARQVEFQLNVPQTASVGIGYTPNDRLSVGLDGRWIDYDDTQGFGGGFDPATGAALGLGWEDVFVWAIGAEYRVGPSLALRGGWNRSESALTPETVFLNVGSPAMFEDHLTLGLGWRLYDQLELNLAAYRAFENEVTGPFLSPAGPVPGTSVTNTIQVDSAVMTLRFVF
jgi:long-chain fatty acid transport protein